MHHVKPDRSREFLCYYSSLWCLLGEQRLLEIRVTPFLVEVMRDSRWTHKYSREPNKLDCSAPTLVEYLTLWGFTRLASVKRTSCGLRSPRTRTLFRRTFGFKAVLELCRLLLPVKVIVFVAWITFNTLRSLNVLTVILCSLCSFVLFCWNIFVEYHSGRYRLTLDMSVIRVSVEKNFINEKYL